MLANQRAVDDATTAAPADDVELRLRMRLLTDEHRDHRLTINLYLNGVGTTDARVWCARCERTLRARGRLPRENEEVLIGIG